MNFQSPRVIWDDSSNQVIPLNYPLDMVEPRTEQEGILQNNTKSLSQRHNQCKRDYFSQNLFSLPHSIFMYYQCA